MKVVILQHSKIRHRHKLSLTCFLIYPCRRRKELKKGLTPKRWKQHNSSVKKTANDETEMSSSSTAIRKTTVKGGGTSAHVTTSTGSTVKTSKSTKGGKKKQQRGFISSNLLFVLLIGFILIWLGVYQYVFPSLMSSSNSNPHHSLLSSYDKIRHKNSDSKSSNSNPYHAGLSPMDWDKIRHNIHHDNVHHQKKERIDGGDHHKLLDHSHDHEQDLLSSKERKRHRQLPPKVATAEDTAVADTAIIQHNNPYEGWQPLIHNDSDGYSDKCKSWRTCFEKIHDCPGKCRDGLDDFGIPPIAPTGIDPYGDEEDNKEKKDAGGQWIPDVTVLRRMMIAGKDSNGNIWPPPLITETNRELCEDIGVFGGKIDDHKGLLNFGSKDSKYIRGLPLVFKDDDPRLVTKQPKILCMVYTMEQNHHTSIRAIRETWGGGCDGFLAFSTKDDPRIPAISLVHDGPEEYNNMVRYMLCFYVMFFYLLTIYYVIKTNKIAVNITLVERF